MKYQIFNHVDDGEKTHVEIHIIGNDSEVKKTLAVLIGTNAETLRKKYKVVCQSREKIFEYYLTKYILHRYKDAWEAARAANKEYPKTLHFVEEIENES